MSAAEQATAAAPQAQAQETDSLLDQILTATRPLDDQERAMNRGTFQKFLEQVVKPGQVISKDVETTIKCWIGELDKTMSAQLNEVMHDPAFQKLEATWRGLHYLVHQSETGEHLKIRVLNVSKRDLFKDLERA